jgi:hypothetical protein
LVGGLVAKADPGKTVSMKPASDPHYRHRFPAETISHAVWLYHVFSLRLRDVELLLAERGIVISYDTVRRWCRKFGRSFANAIRRRRSQPGDKWHLDEVLGARVSGRPPNVNVTMPTGMVQMIALTLFGIVLALTGCAFPAPSTPTGVAAPGHNWLGGGGG